MRNGRVCGLGLAMALTGCGAAAPLVCPDHGGPPWTEIASRHLVLRTDLAPSDARVASEGFELTYAAFEDLAFPFEQKPKDRIVVVLLRDDGEFRVFYPREGIGGFFKESTADGYEDVPLAAFFGRFESIEADTVVSFQHELTHRFVRFYYPQAPVWLNEGLAQYFSTLTSRGGVAVLGRPLNAYGYTGLDLSEQGDRDDHVQRIAAAPTVEALLAMDRQRFYLADAPPDSASAESELQAHYLAAWGLVHLFRNGPEDYRRRFQRMLDAVAEGRKPDVAVDAAFGDLDKGKLQNDFETFLSRHDTVGLQTRYQPNKPAPGHERTMSDLEVHLQWADLASVNAGWLKEPTSKRARADIDEAIRIAPDSIDARLRSVGWYLAHKMRTEAGDELDAALRAHPDDVRVLFAKFERLTAKSGRPGPGELDALVARLAPQVTTSRAMNALAWYLAKHAKVKQGLPLAQRAVASEPGCWECFDTLALLLREAGSVDQAVEAQTLAVNLLPETARQPDVIQRLRDFTQAARDAKAHPAPEPDKSASP